MTGWSKFQIVPKSTKRLSCLSLVTRESVSYQYTNLIHITFEYYSRMPSVSVDQNQNYSLAALLRECASIVERNESSALLFRAVEALNNYAENSELGIRKSKSSDKQQQYSASSTSSSIKKRPEFQRPTNKNSTLIANGWIEQQRKQKLRRVVWKEVLASLVEARKPFEGEFIVMIVVFVSCRYSQNFL